MIAMRAFQGFFGGVLIPMAFTLVFTKLPQQQKAIGLAMFALAVTFAPAIGPTIGGYLTENYGWQTIFFVNVVPTAVMVAMLYFTLERQPMQLGLLREADWLGIATMAIGLSALQAVLEATRTTGSAPPSSCGSRSSRRSASRCSSGSSSPWRSRCSSCGS
jgi:DHA2 family multidrug resistance protein